MWEREIISELYLNMLEEGIEEKIPKLLPLVPDTVGDKAKYITWVAGAFDPTPNSIYTSWILKMLRSRVFRGEEDAEKCRETLEKFTKLKNIPQFPKDKKDINQYKNYGDLAQVLDEFSGLQSKKREVKKNKEEGIEFISEESGYKLYIVTKYEAAATHFRNTKWCVRAPNQFDEHGPPFYYLTKDDSPETLIHLHSKQCMDVYDRPTDLSGIEKNLMEGEHITKYILAHDNDDTSLDFYYSKVGGGYDHLIGDIIQKKIDDFVRTFNLTHININYDNDYYDDYVYFSASADMTIPYDFGSLNLDLEDKDLMRLVREILGVCDIYPSSDSFDYSEPLVDDGIRVNVEYSDEGDYRPTTTLDKLRDFYDDMSKIDNNWEDIVERVQERLTEKLIEKGYISSGYSKFINHVSPIINFNTFTKQEVDPYGDRYKKIENLYISPIIRLNYDGMTSFQEALNWNRSSSYYRTLDKKYQYSRSPIVMLLHFLKPLLGEGIAMSLKGEGLVFRYIIQYDEDITTKEYMDAYKIVKSMDTHWNFYAHQIELFWNIFIRKYYMGEPEGDYDVPDDVKLPLLKLLNRKENEDQLHLDLHEKSQKFDFLLKRMSKLKII